MKPDPHTPASQRDTQEVGQQGAAPAHLLEAHRQLVLATERVLTGEIDAALHLLAEAIRSSAPTPEYVSGWLAGREWSVKSLLDNWLPAAAAELQSFLLPDEIPLAPPSAPPVQQIEQLPSESKKS